MGRTTSRSRYPSGIQEHHVNFPKVLHRAQEPTRSIRQEAMLKPPLYEYNHNSLHRQIGMVPIANYFMAQKIRANFVPVDGDYLRSIDEYLFAVTDMKNHYTSSSLERHLGELIIRAIDLQRPFIREGLWEPSHGTRTE